MNSTDIIVLVIIAGILGFAIFYICKSKKSGKKCIGCPDSSACPGSCGTCGCRCKE